MVVCSTNLLLLMTWVGSSSSSEEKNIVSIHSLGVMLVEAIIINNGIQSHVLQCVGSTGVCTRRAVGSKEMTLPKRALVCPHQVSGSPGRE